MIYVAPPYGMACRVDIRLRADAAHAVAIFAFTRF